MAQAYIPALGGPSAAVSHLGKTSASFASRAAGRGRRAFWRAHRGRCKILYSRRTLRHEAIQILPHRKALPGKLHRFDVRKSQQFPLPNPASTG